MEHSQTELDLDLDGPADGMQRRLGPADVVQIRLLLRVPLAQRIRAMLDMQESVLESWHARLRKAHPELNDLDLCRLMADSADKHRPTGAGG
jgi:hypothetical protein